MEASDLLVKRPELEPPGSETNSPLDLFQNEFQGLVKGRNVA